MLRGSESTSLPKRRVMKKVLKGEQALCRQTNWRKTEWEAGKPNLPNAKHLPSLAPPTIPQKKNKVLFSMSKKPADPQRERRGKMNRKKTIPEHSL